MDLLVSEHSQGAPRYLTVAEVALILRVSKMTIYRLVHAGDLAAMRVGRGFRIPEASVTAYLSQYQDAIG
ncbi:helix-turn-helix domain-containing protein [Streptosporangium sp. NPDC051022]|uniref:helix-turn-helix domain-containing protein n=1 Tax=Streptosporangium sp. NPDC051022 TaxID=3155752 RepID=UPI00343DFD38